MSTDNHGVSRRDFIKLGGAGAVAASLAACASDQSDTRGEYQPRELQDPKPGDPVSTTAQVQDGKPTVPQPQQPTEPRLDGERLGFAIVGLGKFAVGEILPAFKDSEHCRPTALVSGDRGKAEAIARQYRIDPAHIYSYDTMDRLADDADVDVVYVITPPGTHAEYTIRGARAGKHVLCEKPMATSVAQCQEMIETCEAMQRKLMIAYRVHYEPFNRTLIEWTRQKRLGQPRIIETVHTQDVGGVGQWRLDKELAGGGCLFDLGIYGLNATRYLTGEEPTHVSAQWSSPPDDPRFKEVEASITWQLRYPSGVLASCSSSYCAGQTNTIRVVAEKGWYGLEPATSYRGQKFFVNEGKETREEKIQPASHFAAEMDHFARCIREDRTPDTPGEHGLQDVRLMHAIYEAARTGQTMEL